jgi:pyridoxal phosphate enzyme (YggS family)
VDVTANLAEVRRRIAEAGGAERVRLLAVTKGFGVDAVDAALRAGITDIAESYAQELLAKRAEVAAGDPTWHFIGRLQTNKVRQLVGVVDVWQSVDRATLGDELAKRSPQARVLLQVNVSDEPQKGGCGPHEVPALVNRLRKDDLDVVGLMAIGATGEPEAARPGFRLLNRLADDLGLPERSMGMSADLEVAVEEGSTMVRIGRALFGDRPRTGVDHPSN